VNPRSVIDPFPGQGPSALSATHLPTAPSRKVPCRRPAVGRPSTRTGTHLFARALGPFFCIVPASMAARATELQALLTLFEVDPLRAWALGAALLLGGSTIIAAHQYWRGAAAIIISLLGWLLAVRGVLLLLAPQVDLVAADALSGPIGPAFVRALLLCLSVAGLYLTYVGWAPRTARV